MSPKALSPEDTPAVDVVICTRNNRDVIAETLQAVERQTLRPRVCWVIDGRSTDGTVELVRSRFPWVQTAIKDNDTGPAHSRNLGLERCTSEFVVLLDSDVVLADDWIARQADFLAGDSKIAMVCGKLVESARRDRLDAAYCAMNRYGVAWNGRIGEAAESFAHPMRCFSCTTSAVMARRSVVLGIGGFDAAMFAAHEDSDLGWRANIAGYSVYSNPAAVGVHKQHGTLNPRKLKSHLVYLLWRNRLRSLLVNYEWINVVRYVLPFVLFSLADAVCHAPRGPKFRGLWWTCIHLPDTLRRRRAVQRQRRVRDSDLWFLFEAGLRGRARS